MNKHLYLLEGLFTSIIFCISYIAFGFLCGLFPKESVLHNTTIATCGWFLGWIIFSKLAKFF